MPWRDREPARWLAQSRQPFAALVGELQPYRPGRSLVGGKVPVETRCPRCGGPVYRIRRRPVDRL